MDQYFYFFFSSRRRHTRLTCDWSSDVCSSDLQQPHHSPRRDDSGTPPCPAPRLGTPSRATHARTPELARRTGRSEERRVGKECRSRRSPYHEKKKKIRTVYERTCRYDRIIQAK